MESYILNFSLVKALFTRYVSHLACLLIALGYSYGQPVGQEAAGVINSPVAIASFVLGITLYVIWNRDNDVNTYTTNRWLVLPSVCFVILSTALPFPYSATGLLASFYLLAVTLPRLYSYARPAQTVMSALLMLIAVHGLFGYFAANFLTLPFLLYPVGVILRTFGHDVQVSDSFVLGRDLAGDIAVGVWLPNWIPLAVLSSTIVGYRLLAYSTMRAALSSTVILLALVFWRICLVAANSLDTGLPTSQFIAWQDIAASAVISTVALCGRRQAFGNESLTYFSKRSTWLYVSATCIFSVLLLLPYISDFHKVKGGRILVQEFNAEWEASDAPLSINSFGVRSVYSYTALLKEISRKYHVRVSREALSREALDSTDVLILKCPTDRYRPEEVRLVHEFVERGGGLWLIGDHTNVFGMSQNLNELASPFGIQFRYDAVSPVRGSRQLSRGGVLTCHPALWGLSNEYQWYTSASIQTRWPAWPAFISQECFSDAPDFSRNTFFGDLTLTPGEYAGPLCQVAVSTFGKGSIVAWSDSTVFSNFSVYMPGQIELAMSTLDWLNRSFVIDCTGLGVAPIAVLALFFTALTVSRGTTGGVVSISALLGVLVLVSVVRADRTKMFVRPSSRENVWVIVDQSGNGLPVREPLDKVPSYSCTNLVIALARCGRSPMVLTNQRVTTLTPDVLYLRGVWSESSSEELSQWLFNGGRGALLEYEGLQLKANSMLKKIGVNIRPVENKEEIIRDHSERGLALCNVGFVLEGCTPLLKSSRGTVLGIARYGSGALLVSSCNGLFNNVGLGDDGQVPNAAQYELQSIIYSFYEINRAK